VSPARASLEPEGQKVFEVVYAGGVVVVDPDLAGVVEEVVWPGTEPLVDTPEPLPAGGTELPGVECLWVWVVVVEEPGVCVPGVFVPCVPGVDEPGMCVPGMVLPGVPGIVLPG
jgi:hypothetical protein